MSTHVWTPVPLFDVYGRRHGVRALLEVRFACRCGAWCTAPTKRLNGDLVPVRISESSSYRLEWQDGVKCGPPPGGTG